MRLETGRVIWGMLLNVAVAFLGMTDKLSILSTVLTGNCAGASTR